MLVNQFTASITRHDDMAGGLVLVLTIISQTSNGLRSNLSPAKSMMGKKKKKSASRHTILASKAPDILH